MCCGDAPSPDPNIGAAQDKLANLAERQQNWYETNLAPKVLSQLDQSLAISKRQADNTERISDFQLGQSEKYASRYWGTQAPLEDEIIAQARKFNTKAEQERMAGQAGADVEQAGAAGMQSLQRGLRGMGVNPGSAASISAMTDAATQTALARAGAVNKTREAARQLGWTRLGEAAALGRGLPSFGATSAQVATGAAGTASGIGNSGLGAVNSAGNGYANFNNSTAGMYGQIGNLGLGSYNAQVNASSSSDNTFGQLLGVGLGVAQKAGWFSDRRLKTNIVRLGTRDDGLGVYAFNYVWGGPRMVGVMADEVRKVKPHAVATVNGYDVVDYAALG